MPGVTPRPWGPEAHSGIAAAMWPWLESGEPMLDGEALAMPRSDDGACRSPSSAYMPGDALPLLYMYGASAYMEPLS